MRPMTREMVHAGLVLRLTSFQFFFQQSQRRERIDHTTNCYNTENKWTFATCANMASTQKYKIKFKKKGGDTRNIILVKLNLPTDEPYFILCRDIFSKNINHV